MPGLLQHGNCSRHIGIRCHARPHRAVPLVARARGVTVRASSEPPGPKALTATDWQQRAKQRARKEVLEAAPRLGMQVRAAGAVSAAVSPHGGWGLLRRGLDHLPRVLPYNSTLPTASVSSVPARPLRCPRSLTTLKRCCPTCPSTWSSSRPATGCVDARVIWGSMAAAYGWLQNTWLRLPSSVLRKGCATAAQLVWAREGCELPSLHAEELREVSDAANTDPACP